MSEKRSRKKRRGQPVSVFADLYDFVLGTGIIAVPISWFHLRKLRTRVGTDPSWIALKLICLAIALTVELSGLLRGETAKVWMSCAGTRALLLALAFVDIRDAVVDSGVHQSEDVVH